MITRNKETIGRKLCQKIEINSEEEQKAQNGNRFNVPFRNVLGQKTGEMIALTGRAFCGWVCGE